MMRPEIRIKYGETQKVTNDWSAECEERGTTVSASTWTGYGVTVTSPALSSNVATCLVSLPFNAGCLINIATLANGETLVAERNVWGN